jgi:hypothetical protein
MRFRTEIILGIYESAVPTLCNVQLDKYAGREGQVRSSKLREVDLTAGFINPTSTPDFVGTFHGTE